MTRVHVGVSCAFLLVTAPYIELEQARPWLQQVDMVGLTSPVLQHIPARVMVEVWSQELGCH